jgi:hypothetical protein
MYAAFRNSHPQVIMVLLKEGANPKLKSNEGKAAFDYAEENMDLKGTDAYLELKKGYVLNRRRAAWELRPR